MSAAADINFKGPKLSELAGMAEARAWGERIAGDVALYRAKHLRWIDIDPACLLHGPPGTGKTMFAKMLAATCGLPLVATSFAEWQSAKEGHLGTCMAAMKEAFAGAIAQAPCILFIDELDSLPSRGSVDGLASYWVPLVNALLKEFDRLGDIEGVIVVGACNHPEKLDPALVRAGRMNELIEVERPGVAELADIIRFHLAPHERQAICPAGAARLFPVALACTGMTGADMVKIVRGARALARNRRRPLALVDLLDAADPPGRRPDPRTTYRIAVHEAGHAGGGTESDLAQATRLALDAVTIHGLSSRSVVWHGPTDGRPGRAPLDLQREADDLLSLAYHHAVLLVQQEWDFVTSVAAALVRHRALSFRDFRHIDRRPRAA